MIQSKRPDRRKGYPAHLRNSSTTATGTKPHQGFDCAHKNVELLVRDFDADRTSLKTPTCLDGQMMDDRCVATGELRKALRSDSGRIDSTNRTYLEAAIVSILVRPASSIAEQNGIWAMCYVLTEEGKDEGPDDKSDDSPPCNLSALSSVVADIKGRFKTYRTHRLCYLLQ
jgi:hypothetical protein